MKTAMEDRTPISSGETGEKIRKKGGGKGGDGCGKEMTERRKENQTLDIDT